ncbi:hypothetical protein EDC04DRAFT_244171 [Pisolithus marmoratus]|nr:hypothetical protein EDC04DRAFT_244171 [Pisolithus marmoratus]
MNPLMEEQEDVDLQDGPSHTETNEQEPDILSLQAQAGDEDVDPQSHSERNEQESDILSLQDQAEPEGVEVQNDSPHTEEELTVFPPGEEGPENSVTESYSLRTERNVSGSHVFGLGEVEEERDDVDPPNSSPKRGRNVFEIELQVVRTGPAVTEREDPDSQTHSFESEPKAYSIHTTTDILSALPVLVSDSSVCKLGDNSSLVPPSANLESRRDGLMSKLAKKLAKLFRGIQETKGASPKISRFAQNEPTVSHAGPSDADRLPQQGTANQYQVVTFPADGNSSSSRYGDDQPIRDPYRYPPTTTAATTDTREGQTSDGEHDGGCCCCYFKPWRSRRRPRGDN